MTEEQQRPRTKAYSYLRFSTPDQHKGDSFNRQTRMAEEYAEKHGLDLDQSLTFQDLGVSAYAGRNLEKGSLGEFKDAVRAGEVPQGSCLLVENLDRISRQDALQAATDLKGICDLGVTVVTLSDERTYTSESLKNPMDAVMVVLSFVRSHDESLQKGRRMKAAWETKRKKARQEGERLTTWCPAWMDWDEETEEFVVDEAKADLVRRIFRDYLGGSGQVLIAKTFNEEGIPPITHGKHWHRSYIRRTLANPAVIGTLVPGKWETTKDGKRVRKKQEPIPGYYPAVVDEKTYHDVQALLKSRAPKKASSRRVKNLFASLAYCGRCGSTMVRVNKGKGTRKYLVCRQAKMGAGCTYESIRYDYATSVFFRRLNQLLYHVPSADEELEAEIRHTEDLLMVLGDAIEHLQRAIEEGGHSPTLLSRLDDRERHREELEDKLDELRDKQVETSGPLVQARLRDLKEVLGKDEVDPQEANTLMRLVFERVTFDQAAGMMAFEWRHGGDRTELQYAWPEEKETEDQESGESMAELIAFSEDESDAA